MRGVTDTRTGDDLALAVRLAQEAGRLLVDLRLAYGPIKAGDEQDKARMKQLRDEADRLSHEFLVTGLSAARPDDAVLSEEGVDEEERDTAARVWIVDPLDGTWEYGQGRADFAVHVALWDRSADGLLAGVVDLPEQGLTRTSGDEQTAAGIPAGRPIRIVVSRTRPPQHLDELAARVAERAARAGLNSHGVEIVSVGSVGAKVAELLAGRADAYVHDSGFYEWDAAAPMAVAEHYGLVAEHLDGSRVTFNHRPPWVKNLRVAGPELMNLLRD